MHAHLTPRVDSVRSLWVSLPRSPVLLAFPGIRDSCKLSE